MNSDTPLTPGEEAEVRLTAMLMGELSPEEAAALRAQMAANAELEALYARLSRAFDLLREATSLDAVESSEAARMSAERRERLLQHFRKPAYPRAAAISRPKPRWTWLAPVAWGVSFTIVVGFLVLSMMPLGDTPKSAGIASPDFDVDGVVPPTESERTSHRFFFRGNARDSRLSASGGMAGAETAAEMEAPAPSAPMSATPAPTIAASSLATGLPAFPVTPTTPIAGGIPLPGLAPAAPVATAPVDEAAESLSKSLRGGSPGQTLAWQSAPGAIRLPDSNVDGFKTYHSDQMIVNGGADRARAFSGGGAGGLAANGPMDAAKADFGGIVDFEKKQVAEESNRQAALGGREQPEVPKAEPVSKAKSDSLAQSSDLLGRANVPALGDLPMTGGLIAGEKVGSLSSESIPVPSAKPAARPTPLAAGNAGEAIKGDKVVAETDSRGLKDTSGTVITAGKLVITDSLSAAQAPAEPTVNAPEGDTKKLMEDANGFVDTGRYDLAMKRYDDVLKRDPNNVAAREGQERVTSNKERVASAAYNETRSKLLDSKSETPLRQLNETNNFSIEGKPNETSLGVILNPTGRDTDKPGSGENAEWYFRGDGTLAKRSEAKDRLSVDEAPGKPVDNARRLALGVEGLTEKKAEAAKEVDAPVAQQPAVSPPVPQPEIATSANPFSTFSLNVSDVAFKLASASLEQGKMPDPAGIRSEEFINAFDYHDPEPSPGAPLAFVTERARYPFAHNRDLLRFSIKTAAAGRQPGRPLNLVLLLDNSGSMERADRVRILRESLRVLSAQLQPQDKLSIITFARTPRLWFDGVPGNQAAEVTSRVGDITPQGGTNIEAALNLAYETARKHQQVGSISRVVMLTDGAANLGDVNPTALKQKVEAQRKQGIALDCFGVGWEGYNDDLLEQLSRNGDGRYGFINSPEDAATEFAGQLAGALRVAASDVKVQVEFNPKRVTAYRQIGYAKHQLTKEQFRDNTVDAAEIGAAESGNALYVVEVNPGGEGDLATVRARFKVPGTSDYREHEWAVPYVPNVSPLEQASPALRLAATASAFSEWLAGSPYATEITPDQLLGIINGVPSTFGNDPRPQKLEWMIRQAKSVSGR